MWIEVQAKASDDEHTASFPGTTLVYHTSTPVDGVAAVAVGMVGP